MTGRIIGKKLGMSQAFREDGTLSAVTAIEAGPCTITRVKTTEKDGYNAVQLGFNQAKRLKAAQRGQPERFPDIPVGPGEIFVTVALAAFQYQHAVAFLRQPHRRDAAAKPGANHHEIVRFSLRGVLVGHYLEQLTP